MPSVSPDNKSAPARQKQIKHVVAISVDGLAVASIEELGASAAPTLHHLQADGASTLNARTAYEANVTLPNHVGMVTGRRIDKEADGHGVTWNVDRSNDTVQAASGNREIESMFSVAHEAGLSTAIFAGKSKFNILSASWPEALDHVDIRQEAGGPETLASSVIHHLTAARPNLTFWHISSPDAAGHKFGGMTPAYLASVQAVDTAIGEVMASVANDPELGGNTLFVLTADHGVTEGQQSHGDYVPTNYTVPFFIWGPTVLSGDLYDLNPELTDPGVSRPTYDGPQPVRNLRVADVALDALGLPALLTDETPERTLLWR